MSDDINHLDEEWFYTTNRRRKIKRLPLGPNKKPGNDFIPQPKIGSQLFPVKSMFLPVIGCPRKEKGFNGKILLEQVSKTVTISRMVSHQKGSDNVLINAEIKNERWRNFK